MAEEEVVAILAQPSDQKRKLENLESEILEQHSGTTDLSNQASVDDDGKNASDYSQAKRTKLNHEPIDGSGTGNTLETREESKDANHDADSRIEKVQDPFHGEESENKMADNGKPEAVISFEESKEAEDNRKEDNDVIAEKELESESKQVNDLGSNNVDDNENKEANVDGENKEVNGSGSLEEIGDESNEANGGSFHKEVDDTQSTTRRIDVPSSKVGTLIGKGGEMVRYLQVNSGAKIQIRRDAEADPNSALRPVEIIGTVACIEKAEKLINGVIAEAEAGGVPALAARGVPEQMEIKVPNDKVGVIIGRGGETIKNMQTKSRARIQLIPQNAEGDGSKERTVRISGDKRQIDIATALIKDVMYQDGRPSHYSGGFNQPPYQPGGPGGPPQWNSRGSHGPHSMPYNYHHGGPYLSQGSHFRPPNSGGYPPQHMPPRSGYGSGWEQRPPHSGPYDYYGRQGPQNPAHVSSHVAPYSQGGAQQSYGQMYDQPNYDNPPMQQPYGGYGGSQQGYPQAGGQHQMQRPYGMQGSAEQGYGPPRPAAPPAEVSYQGPTPAAPSYGSTPAAPSYSSTPAAPSYGSTPAAPSYGSNMAPPQQYGYNGTQAPAPSIAPAYEQYGVQPASGVQQPSAGYGQAPPTGGYSSYPTTQPAYGNAPAQSNGNYGYTSSQYPSYGGGNASASYVAPAGQTAYSQTAPAQAGYEQSATQSAGYAAAPGTAH